MNKFSILILFLFGFLATQAIAQHKLTGKVTSAVDSLRVEECTIALNNGAFVANTDSLGRFQFNNLKDGTYTLSSHAFGFITTTQTVVISGKNKHVHVIVYPEVDKGDTIKIIGNRSTSHLEDVEDMAIYAGKKSEVIVMDSLVVNTATNNARQVYARVPGLNIWENDGAGIQLSIGGRGLDPNRTSNFNVRQNGYDISADALGYPESYYTPPTEGIERIQVVRGAASLQYGTQFGGMLNFVMRKPVADKKIQLVARQSLGSFGFYNTFTSLGGTVGKLSYYTYFQYKTGNGWRPNSDFDVYNYYGNVNYQISKRTTIGLDITIMNYLAHQPGGLSDKMFYADPRQSNRERNWFQVNWKMAAVHFNHKFNESNEMNVRVFGLLANRYSVGYRPNRVELPDNGQNRDLIKGEFRNIGAELRYMKRYYIGERYNVLLVGARGYYGNNLATQGLGTTGSDANFSYVKNVVVNFPYQHNDYTYRNKNVALFAENIFYIGNKLSITPGLRFEYIHTTADGYYGNIVYDLAGNIILNDTVYEYRSSARHFLLGGIGISYKPISKINVYGNISQNYRSITFSDMRVANPSSVIDPNMKDERGYTMDIGLRSENTKRFIYDASFFILNYNNRIGEYLTSDASNRVVRERTNIGRAVMIGVECYLEYDVLKWLAPQTQKWSGSLFTNSAYIHSEYVSSQITGVQGNQVEFVPEFNFKAGARAGYKKFKMSFQYTHLTQQYSDATNAEEGGVSGVVGIIPAYTIMDLSMSYEYKIFKLEANINNLTNNMYFTRRATGYPGPGILPSDGRAFYLTLQVKI